MRHLDLFSGIGGFALAARRVGWETVAFCEIDPYCQKVLAKHWPGVPIHSDVRELTGDVVGPVDIITGGYPCQPFSLAGKRRGAGDDRHLWPEFARLIRELRPRLVVGENVAGHVTMGLDEVLADLEGLGYACGAVVIPACAVDAQHRRDRVWIVADSCGTGSRGAEPGQHRGRSSTEPAGVSEVVRAARTDYPESVRETLANPDQSGSQGRHRAELQAGPNGASVPDPDSSYGHRRDRDVQMGRGGIASEATADGNAGRTQWSLEPDVGRVAHGVSARVDRIRALGNAIVPQVAEMIFRSLPNTSN